MQLTIEQLYHKMSQQMGPSGWWQADSKAEIIMGAILIQNTNWSNADQALSLLRTATNLVPERLLALSTEKLEQLVRPAGFYRNKSRAMISIFNWLKQFHYDYGKVASHFGDDLRNQLLMLRGIGPETADVLLLFVFDRPTFVSDKYARTLFTYLNVTGLTDYQSLAHLIQLPTTFTLEMAQDFHGLIDEFGKIYFHPQAKFKTSFLAGDQLLLHN